jgi:hypothetical protein
MPRIVVVLRDNTRGTIGNYRVVFGSVGIYIEKTAELWQALSASFRSNCRAALDHTGVLEVTTELRWATLAF